MILKAARTPDESPGMWLFEEPLFFNNFLRTQTLQSASLRSSLREAGCTKLGHLMKMTATSMDTLRARSNITSIRLINRVVEEVCTALPPSLRTYAETHALHDQWTEEGEYSFPSLLITPAVGEWQEGEGKLLSFTTPHLNTFKDAGKKAIYHLCVKVRSIKSLVGLRESRWTEFLGTDVSPKGSWRSLYKLPIEKRTADLQWRVVHGAIATNRYRAHLDPGVGEGCIFCTQTETLFHLFVQCPRLSALFELLKTWVRGFGEVFSFSLFIFGPKYCAREKNIHTLINFVFGSAKLAIWLTRKNRMRSVGSVEPVPVLVGLLKARLKVEHAYFRTTDNVWTFQKIWAVGGVLCSVGEDEELIINF